MRFGNFFHQQDTGIEKCLSTFWAVLLVAVLCAFGSVSGSKTAQAAPTLDGNGWTVFTASADTRTVYLSSSKGNDFNDGLSSNTPVKSIAKGVSLLRSGYPDWLLFNKGDTWTNETIGTLCVSGRSSSEPMLFGSYGTGQRPLLKTNSDTAVFSYGGGCGAGGGDYLAIIGIEFYAYQRDPGSPGFVSPPPSQSGIHLLNPIHWLLIEDCKFSFYAGNAIAIEYSTNQNVSIRRNIIANQYSNDPAVHAQGAFIEKATNLLIEENLFDHNGWNETVSGAGAQVFNHNIYISYAGGANSGGPAIIRGNIFARDASGNQFRTGGTVTNNLFVRNPYGHNLGQPWTGYVSTVQGNVHLEQTDNLANGGTVSAVSSLSTFSSYAGMPFNLGTATISDNILVRRGNTAQGGGIYLDAGQSGNTVKNNVSCTWNSPLTDNGVADIVVGNTIQPTSCDGLGFADPTRSIASYDANILGGPGTLEHFLSLAQAQRKDNWQTALMASAVNSYIRTGYSAAAGPAADTTAPTVPTGLAGTAVSQSQVNLNWNASTDNVGVTGYKLFRNGTQITSVSGTSYQDMQYPGGNAVYSVSAYDQAGNASAQSNGVTAAYTPAPVTVAAPSVVISSPTNGTVIKGNGSVNIAVSAGTTAVTSITIAGDGKILQTCNNVAACSTTWSGKSVTQGTHTVSATALNSSGLQVSTSVIVTALK